MIEWIRFVLIVAIAAVDQIAHEIALSFNTTSDFVKYRLRWIIRDKIRVLWHGRR